MFGSPVPYFTKYNTKLINGKGKKFNVQIPKKTFNVHFHVVAIQQTKSENDHVFLFKFEFPKRLKIMRVENNYFKYLSITCSCHNNEAVPGK